MLDSFRSLLGAILKFVMDNFVVNAHLRPYYINTTQKHLITHDDGYYTLRKPRSPGCLTTR